MPRGMLCCSVLSSDANIYRRHATLTRSIRYPVRGHPNSLHIVHAHKPRSSTLSLVPDKNAQIPSRRAASLVLVPDPDVNTSVAVLATKATVRPVRPT